MDEIVTPSLPDFLLRHNFIWQVYGVVRTEMALKLVTLGA